MHCTYGTEFDPHLLVYSDNVIVLLLLGNDSAELQSKTRCIETVQASCLQVSPWACCAVDETTRTNPLTAGNGYYTVSWVFIVQPAYSLWCARSSLKQQYFVRYHRPAVSSEHIGMGYQYRRRTAREDIMKALPSSLIKTLVVAPGCAVTHN